jgi:hypothetical protein
LGIIVFSWDKIAEQTEGIYKALMQALLFTTPDPAAPASKTAKNRITVPQAPFLATHPLSPEYPLRLAVVLWALAEKE